MPDTYRTRTQLASDLADNISGAITPQNVRNLAFSSVIIDTNGNVDVHGLVGLYLVNALVFASALPAVSHVTAFVNSSDGSASFGSGGCTIDNLGNINAGIVGIFAVDGTISFARENFQVPNNLTFSGAVSVPVTQSLYVVQQSHTTSATVTYTPTNAGQKGDLLELLLVNDSSGTVVATFASTFHSAGTLTTSASHFSTIRFRSDGNRWIELSRTTDLA